MNYDSLGNTGLFVSRLALAGESFLPPAAGADAAPARLLGIALDNGVNLIDVPAPNATADAESLLGGMLGHRRDEVIIAVNVGRRSGPGPNQVGLSRRHLMTSLEASLRRLRTDCIDLCQVETFDPETPIEETLDALLTAVGQGKIRYFGAGREAAFWQIAKALGVSQARGVPGFVALQAEYSLYDRGAEAYLIPMGLEANLGLLVRDPVQIRLDVSLHRDTIAAAADTGQRHGMNADEVNVAWLAHQAITSVIVTAPYVEELEGFLKAVELELSGEDLMHLSTAARQPDAAFADYRWRYPV